jgi:hypothetical protein
VADGDHLQDDFVDDPTGEQHEPAAPDRRVQRRIAASVPVEIHVGTRGIPTRGTTVNLSPSGALVSSRYPFEVGEHCTVHFPLARPGLVSTFTATIVRVDRMADGSLVALEFDDALLVTPGL